MDKEKNSPTSHPDDDIIQKISKEKSPSLQQKLLLLNLINFDVGDLKDKKNENFVNLRGDYEKKYFEIYKKFSNVINSIEAPEVSQEEMTKYQITEQKQEEKPSQNPLSDFYLTAIKNSHYFTLSKAEEKILSHLTEVGLVQSENKVDYSVEFYFSKNPYFENPKLVISYEFNLRTETVKKATISEIKWISKPKNLLANDYKKEDRTARNFFELFEPPEGQEEDMQLEDNDSQFFKNDFLPNILDYYMNFVPYEPKIEKLINNIIPIKLPKK